MIAVWIVGIAFTAVGLVVAAPKLFKIFRCTERTVGRIVSADSGSGTGGQPIKAQYIYAVGGMEYKGCTGWTEYAVFLTGREYKVMYDPAKPERSYLRGCGMILNCVTGIVFAAVGIAVLLCVAMTCMVSLAGCGDVREDFSIVSEVTPEIVETIIFDSDFQILSGLDADELVPYLEKMGDGNYQDIYIDQEGNVCLALADGEHQYWLDAVREKLDEKERELQKSSSLYHCDFSDDCTEINIYYDMCLSIWKASVIGNICIYCAMYQVIEGNNEWILYINIYNKDTNKLVAGGNMREEVHYDNTQWSESYTLDSAEEAALLAQQEGNSAVSYTIHSNMLDAFSLIDFFCTVNGNEYTYLYINEQDEVVLGLDEEERQICLDGNRAYLATMRRQFAGLGDGYQIIWNSDLSVLDFYFDAELSDQDQVNYIGYAATVCMISRILESKDDYIDYNIYNAQDGALVSNGNSEDGISWKMQ